MDGVIIDHLARRHSINRLDQLLLWEWQRSPTKLRLSPLTDRHNRELRIEINYIEPHLATSCREASTDKGINASSIKMKEREFCAWSVAPLGR
jgi:hypothetical protein